MRFIINGCSLDLELLTERDLMALTENQTRRSELLAHELTLLVDERLRRDAISITRLNVVA